jgi:hypothetical protein
MVGHVHQWQAKAVPDQYWRRLDDVAQTLKYLDGWV